MTKEKKPAATRVYKVKNGDTVHLVEASSPGAAVAHVYKAAGLVEIPKQIDLIAMIKAGVQVEKAKVEQPDLPL